MKRMMLVTIGALPIVALSLLPKPVAAETIPGRPFPVPAAVLADRLFDYNRGDSNQRDNERWGNDRWGNDRRDNDRRRDWRYRHSDRRDRRDRYDDRQRYESNGRYGSNGRYDDRRDYQRRVWIPGHWKPGFLGIGRIWVAGRYETR